MNIGELARVLLIRPASEPVPEDVDLSDLEERSTGQGDPPGPPCEPAAGER